MNPKLTTTPSQTEKLNFSKDEVVNVLNNKASKLLEDMCNFQSDKNIFASSYGKISISFHGRDFGEVYKQFEFTNENDLSEKIALLSDDIKNDQYSVSGEIALYDNDTHVSFSSKAF